MARPEKGLGLSCLRSEASVCNRRSRDGTCRTAPEFKSVLDRTSDRQPLTTAFAHHLRLGTSHRRRTTDGSCSILTVNWCLGCGSVACPRRGRPNRGRAVRPSPNRPCYEPPSHAVGPAGAVAPSPARCSNRRCHCRTAATPRLPSCRRCRRGPRRRRRWQSGRHRWCLAALAE